ncbi:MAG: hypothetical protein OEN20_06295 [Gammaproteobacteria bacterium]|nr:hypothetical protein [Gammaproteobacteria bacterium]
MEFIVYRCLKDPDYFLITDTENAAALSGSECPNGGELERLGEFSEMGEDRVAFNEDIAKSAIRKQGYYRIEAKSFDPVAAAEPDVLP